MNVHRSDVVKWAKFLGVAMPVVGASVTLMVYLQDAHATLADIRAAQAVILAELGAQTHDLEEIRVAQGSILRGIGDLGNAIHNGLLEMAGSVGQLIERTSQ